MDACWFVFQQKKGKSIDHPVLIFLFLFMVNKKCPYEIQVARHGPLLEDADWHSGEEQKWIDGILKK